MGSWGFRPAMENSDPKTASGDGVGRNAVSPCAATACGKPLVPRTRTLRSEKSDVRTWLPVAYTKLEKETVGFRPLPFMLCRSLILALLVAPWLSAAAPSPASAGLMISQPAPEVTSEAPESPNEQSLPERRAIEGDADPGGGALTGAASSAPSTCGPSAIASLSCLPDADPPVSLLAEFSVRFPAPPPKPLLTVPRRYVVAWLVVC
jgi:hypothetical protein